MASFPHHRYEARYVPTETIVVEIVGDGFYDRCKVRDVSQHGVSIFVPHGFKGCDIDTQIQMFFVMPDKTSVKAHGRLRHQGLSTKPYFGIEITNFEGQGQAVWGAFVGRYGP